MNEVTNEYRTTLESGSASEEVNIISPALHELIVTYGASRSSDGDRLYITAIAEHLRLGSSA